MQEKEFLNSWKLERGRTICLRAASSFTHLPIGLQIFFFRSQFGQQYIFASQSAGFIKFQPNQNGGTAVHIQFAYNPPGGIIGHVFASLFGADPKHALEDDMARLKTLFEIGKTRVHHHRITREELEHQISSARSEFRPPETSTSIRRKSREAS